MTDLDLDSIRRRHDEDHEHDGGCDTLDLLAEVERLTQWKAEAMEVLAGWERVWEELGYPGEIGQSKAAAALLAVQAQALAERRDHLADGPDETWPDEAHELGVSVWHGPVFAAQLRAVLDERLGGDQ